MCNLSPLQATQLFFFFLRESRNTRHSCSRVLFAVLNTDLSLSFFSVLCCSSSSCGVHFTQLEFSSLFTSLSQFRYYYYYYCRCRTTPQGKTATPTSLGYVPAAATALLTTSRSVATTCPTTSSTTSKRAYSGSCGSSESRKIRGHARGWRCLPGHPRHEPRTMPTATVAPRRRLRHRSVNLSKSPTTASDTPRCGSCTRGSARNGKSSLAHVGWRRSGTNV